MGMARDRDRVAMDVGNAKQPKTPRTGTEWPSVGTPRLPARAYPAPAGVGWPKLHEDGRGPLNLGLPPPHSKKAVAAQTQVAEGVEGAYTLKEAMRLTVQSKPWNEEEDRKLAQLVEKHGALDHAVLEKHMKRSWGSLSSRITLLMKRGTLPAGCMKDPNAEVKAPVAPPRRGGAWGGATIELPPGFKLSHTSRGDKEYIAPNGRRFRSLKEVSRYLDPTNGAGSRPASGRSGSGGSGGGGGGGGRGPNGEPAVELDKEEVDRKLWINASTSGWRVVEACPGGARTANWKYVAPSGEHFRTRTAAFEHSNAMAAADAAAAAAAAAAAEAGVDEGAAAGDQPKKVKVKGGKRVAAAAAAPVVVPTRISERSQGSMSESLTSKLSAVPEIRNKTQAKQICGKAIEIFWDGEDQWFEAEVRSFDPATGMHVVLYRQDAYECEERLMLGGPDDPTIWRHAIRSTARGLAAKGQALL